MILNLEEGNKLISENIINNNIFSVSRMGIGEVNLIHKVLKGSTPSNQDIEIAKNFGGVYGDCFDTFLELYIESVKKSDINCFWMNSNLDVKQNEIFDILSPNSHKVNHRTVEPYFLNSPWSLNLNGKKVLVINPFSYSIKQQYLKIKNIWGDKKVLPDFDLITYKSVQSVGELRPHSSWIESLNIMKEDISKIDFEIALLGCGTYGLPLVNFIKNDLKKSSIYVGGAIQIMFGIRGQRWDNHDEINKFFNENWVYPNELETPENYKILEGGCYWK
jgi:hypothetical protein